MNPSLLEIYIEQQVERYIKTLVKDCAFVTTSLSMKSWKGSEEGVLKEEGKEEFILESKFDLKSVIRFT